MYTISFSSLVHSAQILAAILIFSSTACQADIPNAALTNQYPTQKSSVDNPVSFYKNNETPFQKDFDSPGTEETNEPESACLTSTTFTG